MNEWQVVDYHGRDIRGWTVIARDKQHALEVARREQDRKGGMGIIDVYELYHYNEDKPW